MLGKAKNISGLTFGRAKAMTCVGRAPDQAALWECICECGTTFVAKGPDLRSGNTKSCGCLRSEKRVNPPPPPQTHGDTVGKKKSPEYVTWSAMKNRCYTESAVNYPIYGGRGITVCDRWRDSFEAFLEDMGRRPSLSHTIDRIDKDGDYEPGNCRWANPKQQGSNTSKNKFVTINGETLHYREAARRFGKCPWGTISARIHKGWDPADAILTPSQR